MNFLKNKKTKSQVFNEKKKNIKKFLKMQIQRKEIEQMYFLISFLRYYVSKLCKKN